MKESIANLASGIKKVATASSETEVKANKAFDLADIVQMKVAQEKAKSK